MAFKQALTEVIDGGTHESHALPPESRAVERQTSESKVLVEVDLDGTGRHDVSTGVGFYDHMLISFARHALVDLTVQTEGDTHIDAHHTVEDTAIVLGQALREALGDKAGIRRFGDATVPLDEALVQAVVDVSGRPYCVHTGEPEGQQYVLLGGDGYLGSLTRHVFETLAFHAHLALHVRVLAGREPHHIVETQFKAFARAFRDAVALDPRETGVPSHQGRALSAQHPERRRPRLRVGQPALRRARGRARRRRGDADRRLRHALDADGLRRARRRGVRRLHGGPARVKGERIIGRRLAGGRPVLGICVGMQVLFARGVEHGVETEGCDEWPGVVERLQAPVVPHMGWNTVDVPAGTTLFAGIEDERFYFVHSYGVRDWTLRTNGRTRAPLVTWAEHGGDRFVAAVENGPLTATQFHPEKSGDAGAALLRNWVRCDARDEQGARPAPRRAGARGGDRRGRPGRARPSARSAARPASARSPPGCRSDAPGPPACSPSAAGARPARRSRSSRRSTSWCGSSWAAGRSPWARFLVSLLAAPVLYTMLFRRS